jgi:NADH-quinone oxidoreductase subunit H
LTALNNPGWGLVGNLLAVGYFILKVYLLCFVFIWVRTTLPRLRPDQLMQFAWLILMPVTLGNIILTGFLYLLIVATFGAPVWIFLIILGAVNWAALYLFINLVSRVTVASTRRAQAPAIRAQLRSKPATPTPALPLRDGIPARVAELPQSVSAGGGR